MMFNVLHLKSTGDFFETVFNPDENRQGLWEISLVRVMIDFSKSVLSSSDFGH